ncbi:MAG: flagellar biosynthetic protein FliR [Armatimonadetes bacterium]|nr:flagellar biosynthetic protein FliR [Armatimonadota bacterium]
MNLDAAWMVAFLAVLCRMTAMIMTAPIYGQVVPLQIRAMFCMVVSVALTPALMPFMPPVPQGLGDFAALFFRECTMGLALGWGVQLLVNCLQMAGAITDLQIGMASAQVFNPAVGGTASPIANLKVMLGTVLILLLGGHHMMFQAFMESYRYPSAGLTPSQGMLTLLLQLLFRLLIASVQIAAPVVGVTIVIDAAASLVNKAVPQTQPFLISMPVKICLGLLALMLGLPTLVVAVQRGMDAVFTQIPRLIGGG